MTKGHTYGPWEKLPNADGSFEIYPAHVNTWPIQGEYIRRPVIAEVKPQCAGKIKKIDETEANARLISKAPEMYTALRQTLRVIQATRNFLYSQDLDGSYLTDIACKINGLLLDIDYDYVDD